MQLVFLDFWVYVFGHKPSFLGLILLGRVADGDHFDYLHTNWLAYLYGRIQSPGPDVIPNQWEGITRAASFG